MTDAYVPTPRLRFVYRDTLSEGLRVLQQWFAPDMPGYMRDPKVGEWRDVPVEMGEA